MEFVASVGKGESLALLTMTFGEDADATVIPILRGPCFCLRTQTGTGEQGQEMLRNGGENAPLARVRALCRA